MLRSIRRLNVQQSTANCNALFARRPPSTCSSGISTPTRLLSNSNNYRRGFSSSAAASTASSTLYMWGTDSKGSLLKPADRADEKKLDVPTAVTDSDWKTSFGLLNDTDTSAASADTDVTIQSVTCGPTDTAWILSNGRCFVAGENKNGQAAVGHKNPVTAPTQVILPSAADATDAATGVKQVALGSNFSAFVDTAGDLYTAGFGGSAFSGMGYLGHGDGESYYSPKLVESLVEDGCVVDSVQVGEAHMTVLTTEGEVLTAGAGSYGRLGNFETIDQLYLEPVEILTKGVTQIAGGKSFTLALTDEGVLYGWGRNHKGQLGTGYGMAVDMYAMEPVPSPIEADELLGRKVVHVAAGHSHAACITESGELFYWGMSLYLEPVRVNELLHTTVVDVVCGDGYVLVLDKDGQLYSFGNGKHGALGQGSVKQLNQAAVMEALQDKKVTSMSAGWKHAACLAQDV
jgi:alpha-tubulin suppressor-like RCC1 family protein